MYSIVMAAALVASPETPDFFKKSYGYGCGGCGGYYVSSCYGCGGCCGGWSCSGCCGGYTVSSGWGCCGGWSCSGCCGGYTVSSCWGCCGGCWGGCHGCHGAVTVSSCLGCCGGGCCGGYVVPTGVYTAPAAPITGAAYSMPGMTSDVPTVAAAVPANRAQVVIKLPAEAKLFADGQATTLTGTERVFQTPDLTPGRDFQYTFKAEVPAGAETKTLTKQVVVRAGHQTVVDFAQAADKAASSVTVNLPEKAKLFVDGTATPATGGTHTFRTPELTKGKSYVYSFRAEVAKDGKTEVQTREVTFQGGEPVVVDFTADTDVRTASVK